MLAGYTPEQDTLSGQLVNIKSIKVDDERETRVGSFMSYDQAQVHLGYN